MGLWGSLLFYFFEHSAQAGSLHGGMSLQERVETAAAGLVLQDLWTLLAHQKEERDAPLRSTELLNLANSCYAAACEFSGSSKISMEAT